MFESKAKHIQTALKLGMLTANGTGGTAGALRSSLKRGWMEGEHQQQLLPHQQHKQEDHNTNNTTTPPTLAQPFYGPSAPKVDRQCAARAGKCDVAHTYYKRNLHSSCSRDREYAMILYAFCSFFQNTSNGTKQRSH